MPYDALRVAASTRRVTNADFTPCCSSSAGEAGAGTTAGPEMVDGSPPAGWCGTEVVREVDMPVGCASAVPRHRPLTRTCLTETGQALTGSFRAIGFLVRGAIDVGLSGGFSRYFALRCQYFDGHGLWYR